MRIVLTGVDRPVLDADLVGAGRAFGHRLTRAESEP